MPYKPYFLTLIRKERSVLPDRSHIPFLLKAGSPHNEMKVKSPHWLKQCWTGYFGCKVNCGRVTEGKGKHLPPLKKLSAFIYTLLFRQQVLIDCLTGLIFPAQDMSNPYWFCMEVTDILEKGNRALNILAGIRTKCFLQILKYVPESYRL